MSEEDVRRRVGMLAGCLLCLAVIPGDEAASHGRFHKFLVRLLHEWPKAAPVLRSRFDGWPTRLPPSRQNGVWELEMTLRAIR